eukprot:UN13099
MEIQWDIISDFAGGGGQPHRILLKHIQDPDNESTERLLYLDGEEVVNEISADRKFELDIGDEMSGQDEIDVVIEHNQELTRYDYFLYINEVEYGDKVTPYSKRTGGMKQTLRTTEVSAKE